VDVADFDTVFYPGGHGPLWDLARDENSIALIEQTIAAGKPVALVCHAPGVLRDVRASGGQPLVFGKRVTGFKNSEEAAQIMNSRLSYANQRLAEQSAELEELFSIVAHDLKRPVMALDCSLKLLRAEAEAVLSDDARRFLATSRGEGAKWGLDEQHPVALHFRRELDRCIANMKVLKKRGLRILPGGDYGFAWNPIGTNARDLEHFVTLLGFSPLEAITAATKLGGALMQRGDELGQVRAGYLADQLLVDGNPLENINLVADPDKNFLVIMKDGRIYKDTR